MRVKVQVVIESDCGETEVIQELAQLQRDTLHPETLGLTLAEAKTVLQNVQRKIVEQQVSEYLEQQAICSECGQKRLTKDNRSIVYRTLFGKLKLRGTRLFRCDRQPHSTKIFSPLSKLLPERTSPELLYLESKFASLMSYGLTVQLFNWLRVLCRS